MNHTFIIAEIGVNHNADLSLAYRLIDEAAATGADAVKFQAAIPELVATQYAQKAGYQKKVMALDESQLDMIKKLHTIIINTVPYYFFSLLCCGE